VASIVGAATTTIVGSYEAAGESGDGGPTTAATLDQPTALARDKADDVFIADTLDDAPDEFSDANPASSSRCPRSNLVGGPPSADDMRATLPRRGAGLVRR
jgi:hypothetical protein